MKKNQFTVSRTTGKSTNKILPKSITVTICLNGVCKPLSDFTLDIYNQADSSLITSVSSFCQKRSRKFSMEEVGEGIIKLCFITPNVQSGWSNLTCEFILSNYDEKLGYGHFELSEDLSQTYVGDFTHQEQKEETNHPLTTAEEKLDALIGLTEVKREIRDARIMTQFQQQRQLLGIQSHGAENRHHMLFLGNPGTGKTTVAKLIAEMYHNMGVLSVGHTVVTNRNKLVGEYIGATENNMNEAMEEARGGVLFIDEAYSLFTDAQDNRDYGKRIIESLMTLLSDPNPDCIVILAGYEKEMERLLTMNPGLKDRFPTHVHFKDFSAQELYDIACSLCKEQGYTLSPYAAQELLRVCTMASTTRTPDFGNARWVRNLFEQGITRVMARRVLTNSSYSSSLHASCQHIGTTPHATTFPGGRNAMKKLFTTIEPSDIIEAERLMFPSTTNPKPHRIGFCR